MSLAMPHALVPTYYLYGEPHRAVDHGFLHVETLDDRSRPSGWTIRPHAHADLVQLFLIERGGGTMFSDDAVRTFVAPAMLLVPANVVHGFRWHNDSAGAVTTLARSHFDTLAGRDPAIGAIFASVRLALLDPAQAAEADAYLRALMRELGWSAPGHRAAVEGALLGLLVLALRAIGPAVPDDPRHPGKQAALVARFRARIDARFRLREGVADHAAALGVGESSLRAACARIAAAAPATMLDQRAVLEARLALLYSNLTVAQIGYSLGFGDPGYFSRFFARHAGVSPRAYRDRRGVT